MKKTILFFLGFCLAVMVQAQVPAKPLSIVCTAGKLDSIISKDYFTYFQLTSLTITGTMDARDFHALMNIPNLSVLDISGVTIAAYSGTGGTRSNITNYLANALPPGAFSYSVNNQNLYTQITLPTAITAIGNSAFQDCNNLTSIIIPSGVTSIGDYAFGSCSSLQSVSIPSIVSTIGDGAFGYCTKLNFITLPSELTAISNGLFEGCNKLYSLTIPSKVTSIDIFAFSGCTSLASISIPVSVTSIGGYAFGDCSSLQSITLPSKLTHLSDDLFHNCSSLTSVSIPASVNSMMNGVFMGCTSLTAVSLSATDIDIRYDAFEQCAGLITVDPNNKMYSSTNGVLFTKNQGKIICYPSIKTGSYIIPSTVATIGIYAFEMCKKITSVTIPSSVTYIESYAFANCTGLISIYVNNKIPIDLSNNTFSGSIFLNIDVANCTLYVPYGSKAAYQTATQWKSFTNIVELPGAILSQNAVTIAANNGSTATIGVSSNTTWFPSSNKTWLTPTISYNTNVLLTATANIGAARTATVTISEVTSGTSFTTATITQAAGSTSWNGTGTWNTTANWNNATLPSGGSVVVESGELTIDQDVSVTDLTINPNAKLTLNPGITITIAGTFIIKSSNQGLGTFINAGYIAMSNKSYVEQYLTAGRNWYISTPVMFAKSNTIKTPLTNKLWSYDEPTANWTEISNATTSLSVMKGYISNVAKDTVISYFGYVNGYTQTLDVYRTGKTAASGFNLIGNPFQACVNWDMAVKTNLDSSFWYRTKNTNNAYVFDTYNASLHIGTNNNGKGAVTKYIPPMQAVWIRVDSTKTSGTLTFDNTMLSHPVAGNTLKSDVTITNIRLKVSNDKNSDETIIVFNENASNSFDNYDSEKMFGTNKDLPELYTIADAEKLVINGLESVAKNSNIPLGFKTAKAGTFTISANEINGLEGIPVILEDKLLNKTQDLTQTASYTFASDSVNDTTRFAIRLKADNGPFCCGLFPDLESGVNTIDDNSITVFAKGNTITINSTDINNGTASVYNLLGQEIVTSKITGTTTVITESISAGTYFVKIEKGKTVVTKKIIIE